MPRIYLDSHTVIDAIMARQQEKSQARTILKRLPKKFDEIYIPQIIIGEIFTKIIQKSPDNDVRQNIQDLLELLFELIPGREKYNHCTPQVTAEIYEKAGQIFNEEPYTRMDHHDAILVAHAICDPSADALFTSDNAIHSSTFVTRHITEIENNGRKFRLLDGDQVR
jgi:predicted nucleic acid-binding protein